MPSKKANKILENATIRCRKAQSFARPFTHKKKVKAGTTVQEKMVKLIKMTKESDYGELTMELKNLDMMIEKMQTGVLERLLESVQTIERRMKSYQKALLKDSTDDIEDEIETSQRKVSGSVNNEYSREDTSRTAEDTSHTAENTDGWNGRDDEVGLEMTPVQQERFVDRLRNFFSFQRVAAQRVKIIDPLGKVRHYRYLLTDILSW